MKATISAILFVAIASPVLAEPVSEREARRALFSHTGGDVTVLDVSFLSEAEKATLEAVGAQLQYYGAIAVSPGDGMLHAGTVAGANHHSTEAAEHFALEACEAVREAEQPCEIAAIITPRRWEEGQVLQLSQAGTIAFRDEYRRVRDEKAFAASPETGQYAIHIGENAEDEALNACEAAVVAMADNDEEEAPVSDCIIVVSDSGS
ncbi:5-aminolevulic acid synthase [Cochlodiniinecator piscidefendens]|uniref:5-aminolevulic acid synthase n=1 Tax=Cochlodiniinecator piscidefendens TaxID=2715756 RepID=UPI00140B8A27|nr:5-aminolevulic acid synthase [Cochlodiniinecator piscidefendens]